MRLKLFLTLTALSALLATHSLAQTGGGQSNAVPTYTINFYTLGWSETVGPLTYDSGGREGERSLLVSNGAPSGPFRYVGPSPLTFFETVENTEGGIQKVPQAQIALSGDSNRPVLLLFLKNNEQTGLPYNVLGLPNAINFERRGADNEVFIMNISDENLVLMLNEQQVSLSASGQQRVRVRPKENGAYSLQIAQEKTDGWELVVSTMWYQNGDAQNIVFIVKDPQNDRLRLRRFSLPPQQPARQG